MRVLVCGSRGWTNRDYLESKLDDWDEFANITELIEGEAIGADELAGDWAQERFIPIVTREPWVKVRPNRLYSAAVNDGWHRGFPALWDEHGKSAGPRRNTEMLKQNPEFVIAFTYDIKTSSGTRNMIEQVHKAGLPYIILPGFQKL